MTEGGYLAVYLGVWRRSESLLIESLAQKDVCLIFLGQRGALSSSQPDQAPGKINDIVSYDGP